MVVGGETTGPLAALVLPPPPLFLGDLLTAVAGTVPGVPAFELTASGAAVMAG